VSVSEELTLPIRTGPGITTQGVRYEPLGGNGLVAPHAQYSIDNFETTGDASGGVINQTITCDPRYSCLLAFVSTTASGGTISAAVGCRIVIRTTSAFEWAVAGLGSYVSPDATSRLHWSPDPVFDFDQIRIRWDNVDAASFRSDCIIYLFEKNVKQKVPLPTLLACLPRSASLIP
jgi:hypothetical protein